MTDIDFYILPDVERSAAMRFACRLSAKARRSGREVHVHCADEPSALALDELMWAYPPASFLPHGVGEPEAGIRIDWREPDQAPHDVLINLSQEVPTFFGRFERLAEIVVGEDKTIGRERYSFYRHRGYPLKHHELTDWDDG